MPTLDRADQQLMTDAFFSALNRWNRGGGFGSGGTAPPSTSSPSTGAAASSAGGLTAVATAALRKTADETVGLIKGFGGSLFDLTGSFIKGGVTVGQSIQTLTENFKQAGIEGSDLAKVIAATGSGLGEVVKYVEEGVNSFRQLSSSGAAFNNNVIEMRVAAANTRLTLEDYSDVVKNNIQGLAGLGGSVSSGVKVFSEFSKSFFDTGVADNLKNMGYTTKDLNELLALQISATRTNKILTGDALNAQIKAAGELGTEMDLVAKLTGKSRKEQEEEMRKRQENGQLQAAVTLAIAKGGDGVKNAFNQMSTAAAVGGKDFQKMQEEIFAMGRPSQEMAEKFALAGGAAQKLMMQAADAAKKGDESTAKRLTQEAAIAYAEQQSSKTTLTLASQGHRSAIEGYESSMKFKRALDSVAEEQGLNLKNENDRAKALDIAREKIEKEQKARDGATSTVINAESRMADMTAAINNQVVLPLNQSIGPELMKFSKMLEDVNKGAGGFRTKVEKPLDEIGKNIQKKIDEVKTGKETGDSLKTAIAQGLKESKGKLEGTEKASQAVALNDLLRGGGPGQSQAIAKLEEMAKEQGKTKEQLLTETIKGSAEDIKSLREKLDVIGKSPEGRTAPLSAQYAKKLAGEGKPQGETVTGAIGNAIGSVVATTLEIAGNLIVKGQMKGFSEGTAGTGALIRDFGEQTIAALHGKEAVLTEEQMKNFVKGAKESGLVDAVATLKDSLPKDITGSDKNGLVDAVATLKDSLPKDITGSDKNGLVDAVATLKDSLPKDITGSDNKLDLSKINLPGFGGQIKANAATISPAVTADSNQSSAETARLNRQANKSQPTQSTTSPAPAGQTATGKSSTLDDVVKGLDQLNKQMGILINQQSDLLSKQVRAIKANSSNIYDRT